MKSFRELQTEKDKELYYKLNRDYPKIYSQAILTADCLGINHKLPVSVRADIEMQMIMFALEIIESVTA